MKLESVRELKHIVPAILAKRFRKAPDTGMTFSFAAARVASAAAAFPRFALGITYAGKKQYKLAVRVQNRRIEGGEVIEAIREQAHGEVDVRYIGRVYAGAKRSSRAKAVHTKDQWQRGRLRPLLPGCSCGFAGRRAIMAGTLGCFVRKGRSGPALILSNNHVLADENRLSKGAPIVQPATLDMGRARDRIAVLEHFVPLHAGKRRNTLDVATARLDAGVEMVATELRGLGTLAGARPSPLLIGDRVAKIGRTTGLTRGRVTAIEVDGMSVQYQSGVYVFDDQVEVEGVEGHFSDEGDSGALIVDEELRGAALLFAGSDHGGSRDMGLTYAHPLARVLDDLGASLIH